MKTLTVSSGLTSFTEIAGLYATNNHLLLITLDIGLILTSQPALSLIYAVAPKQKEVRNYYEITPFLDTSGNSFLALSDMSTSKYSLIKIDVNGNLIFDKSFTGSKFSGGKVIGYSSSIYAFALSKDNPTYTNFYYFEFA